MFNIGGAYKRVLEFVGVSHYSSFETFHFRNDGFQNNMRLPQAPGTPLVGATDRHDRLRKFLCDQLNLPSIISFKPGLLVTSRL